MNGLELPTLLRHGKSTASDVASERDTFSYDGPSPASRTIGIQVTNVAITFGSDYRMDLYCRAITLL